MLLSELDYYLTMSYNSLSLITYVLYCNLAVPEWQNSVEHCLALVKLEHIVQIHREIFVLWTGCIK